MMDIVLLLVGVNILYVFLFCSGLVSIDFGVGMVGVFGWNILFFLLISGKIFFFINFFGELDR